MNNPDLKNIFESTDPDGVEKVNLKMFENISKLKITKKELEEVFNNEKFEPEKLIEILKKQFPKIYEQKVNVREGYTLEEHTLMIMKQFEKYFKDKELPLNFNKNIFRLILALHDIGKIEAIAKENKQAQYGYNQEYINSLFSNLKINYKPELINVLVGENPIGGYLIGKISLEEAKNKIKDMANQANENEKDFFDLVCIYYKVDAGSYTKNAGGNYPDPEKPGLDSLFIFDEKNGNLDFSPKNQKKINALKNSLN